MPDLIAHHIAVEDARSNPANARLRGSGIRVWALIGDLPLVNNDPEALAAEFEIAPAAVRAALAYYELHRALIDARLEENRGGMVMSDRSICVCTRCRLAYPSELAGGTCGCGGTIAGVVIGEAAVAAGDAQGERPLRPDPQRQPQLF